jgi:hypothetical protein
MVKAGESPPRRIRWRVVALVTGCVVLGALLIAQITSGVLRTERLKTSLVELGRSPELQAASGGENCRTPTYRLGRYRVVLLQAVEYLLPPRSGHRGVDDETDGWLLHLVIEDPAGEIVDETGRSLVTLEPVGAIGGRTLVVHANAGWTWGEIYYWSQLSGDRRIPIMLRSEEDSWRFDVALSRSHIEQCRLVK